MKSALFATRATHTCIVSEKGETFPSVRSPCFKFCFRGTGKSFNEGGRAPVNRTLANHRLSNCYRRYRTLRSSLTRTVITFSNYISHLTSGQRRASDKRIGGCYRRPVWLIDFPLADPRRPFGTCKSCEFSENFTAHPSRHFTNGSNNNAINKLLVAWLTICVLHPAIVKHYFVLQFSIPR